MKILTLILFGALFLLSSCRMFTAWRSIPAPGGCEECHQVPISANWQVSYRPAALTDERGGASFQSPESLMPRIDKPSTTLEQQKVEGLACFECHNAPDSSHKTRKGKFHH
ncbi:MAG: cytochrome [Deltaproteobacteria bacterium]|nr:cytochrome [Deltaproteobacteria bacterium]